MSDQFIENASEKPRATAQDRRQWALHYAKLGWRIFPCRPGTKQPQYKDCYLDATCDPAKIKAWWSEQDYNIGRIFQNKDPDGLWAAHLDLDCKNGKDGVNLWKDMVATTELERLDGYARYRTPNNGLHFVFRGERRLQYRGSRPETPGLEILAGKHYAVLPPSSLPEGDYVWEIEPTQATVLPAPESYRSLSWQEHRTSRQGDGPQIGTAQQLRDLARALAAKDFSKITERKDWIDLILALKQASGDLLLPLFEVLSDEWAGVRARGRHKVPVAQVWAGCTPNGEVTARTVFRDVPGWRHPGGYQRHAALIDEILEACGLPEEGQQAAEAGMEAVARVLQEDSDERAAKRKREKTAAAAIPWIAGQRWNVAVANRSPELQLAMAEIGLGGEPWSWAILDEARAEAEKTLEERLVILHWLQKASLIQIGDADEYAVRFLPESRLLPRRANDLAEAIQPYSVASRKGKKQFLQIKPEPWRNALQVPDNIVQRVARRQVLFGRQEMVVDGVLNMWLWEENEVWCGKEMVEPNDPVISAVLWVARNIYGELAPLCLSRDAFAMQQLFSGSRDRCGWLTVCASQKEIGRIGKSLYASILGTIVGERYVMRLDHDADLGRFDGFREAQAAMVYVEEMRPSADSRRKGLDLEALAKRLLPGRQGEDWMDVEQKGRDRTRMQTVGPFVMINTNHPMRLGLERADRRVCVTQPDGTVPLEVMHENAKLLSELFMKDRIGVAGQWLRFLLQYPIDRAFQADQAPVSDLLDEVVEASQNQVVTEVDYLLDGSDVTSPGSLRERLRRNGMNIPMASIRRALQELGFQAYLARSRENNQYVWARGNVLWDKYKLHSEIAMHGGHKRPLLRGEIKAVRQLLLDVGEEDVVDVPPED